MQIDFFKKSKKVLCEFRKNPKTSCFFLKKRSQKKHKNVSKKHELPILGQTEQTQPPNKWAHPATMDRWAQSWWQWVRGDVTLLFLSWTASSGTKGPRAYTNSCRWRMSSNNDEGPIKSQVPRQGSFIPALDFPPSIDFFLLKCEFIWAFLVRSLEEFFGLLSKDTPLSHKYFSSQLK